MELLDLNLIKGEETFTFFASPYQSSHFIPLLYAEHFFFFNS